MAFPKKSQTFDSSDWVSKSEAARLRGVSRQAIWELVKRGRLKPSLFNGRAYLKRADVMNFEYGKRGPYSRIPAAELLTRLNLKKKYDPSKWYSLTEAAHAIGISPQAIADLVRRRRLKKLLVEDRMLVLRSSVQIFKSQRGAKGTKKK